MHTKSVALFLILLVINMPIVFSVRPDVYSVEASGKDKIPGFAQQTDMLTITATVSDGNETSPSQVEYHATGSPFTSCDTSTLNGYFDCMMTLQLRNVRPDVYTFRIDLFSENHTWLDSKDGSYAIDHLAPSLALFNLRQSISTGQSMGVTYKVTDKACATCGNVCVGVQSIRFMDEVGTPIVEMDNNDTSGACTVQGQTDIPLTSLASGDHQLCMDAIDRFGQRSQRLCRDFRIDAEAPSFDLSTWKISRGTDVFYDQATQLAYVSARGASGTMSINVTDPGASTLTSVLANLSLFSGSASMVAGRCSAPSRDKVSSCSWSNLRLRNATGSIVLIANDSAGNSAKEEIPIVIKLDTTAPNVTAIHTQQQGLGKGGKDAVTGLTNITATVEERESGMAHARVYADLSQITGNGADSYVPANNCTGSWTCTWFNIPGDGADGSEATITISGTDDAGNSLEPATAIFAVDNQPPTLLSLSFNLSNESEPIETPGFNRTKELERNPLAYYRGEALAITATVKDLGSDVVEAFINASSLTNNSQFEQITCVNNTNSSTGNEFLCSWQSIGPITGTYRNADLMFFFKDAFGHTSNTTKRLTIRSVIDVNETDNYILEIDKNNIFPKDGISRLTITLIPNPPGYMIFVPFTLRKTGTATPGVEVLSIDPSVNCELDNSTDKNFAYTYADLFPNATALSRSVTQANEANKMTFALTKLKKAEVNNLYHLTFHCMMDIYERTDREVFTMPEKENYTVTLFFRGTPLGGDPGEELIGKIKDAQSSALADWKIIGDMNDFLQKIKALCNLIRQIINLWNTFYELEVLGVGMINAAKKLKAAGAPVRWIGKGAYLIGCNGYKYLAYIIMPLWYSDFQGWKYLGGVSCSGTGQNKYSTINVQGAFESNFQANMRPQDVQKRPENWKRFEGRLSMRYLCGLMNCEFGIESLGKADWNKELTVNGVFDPKGGLFGDAINNAVYTGKGAQNPAGGNGPDQPTSAAGRFFGSHFNLRASMDAQNSMIAAIAQRCVPAIIYNLQKYRVIQCQYIQCLRKLGTGAADISNCDAGRSQAWCMVIFGELIEVIGPLNVMRAFSQQFKNWFVNGIPAAILDAATGAGKMCSAKNFDSTTDTCPEKPSRDDAFGGKYQKDGTDCVLTIRYIIMCQLPGMIFTTMDYVNRAKQYGSKDYFNTMFAYPPQTGNDICEDATCKKWNYLGNCCADSGYKGNNKCKKSAMDKSGKNNDTGIGDPSHDQ
ncbi:hypothetical protein HZB02_07040 [Candidatus Woesearchaeota archaeon]|nr:hypothetical protein [Candidatus Woesearchaeota archaeon]